MRAAVLVLATVVMLFLSQEASAQMFNPLESMGRDTSLNNAGRLTGDRRFLRQNRQRGDFVGRNDESQGFVGQTQGRTEGRVQTATSTLREEPILQVNVPRPAAARTGIYEPRLAIAFDVPLQQESVRAAQIQTKMARAFNLKSLGGIEVSLQHGVALLRGAVDSAEARDRAALMVLMEPGVQSVQNDLEVQDPSPVSGLP
ncbi:MAG: BON domain-containing protein [Planctomycetaceae bacterium]|nr:BON domain-containing protein [Planctomycetaceae bacterium]